MSVIITREARRKLGLDPQEFGERGKISLRRFASAYGLADALRRSGVGDDGGPIEGPDLAAFDLLDDLTEQAVDRLITEQGSEWLADALRALGGRYGEERSKDLLRHVATELELDATAASETDCARELLVMAVLLRHPLARRILGGLGVSEEFPSEVETGVEWFEHFLAETAADRDDEITRRLPRLEQLAGEDPDSFAGSLEEIARRGGPWLGDFAPRIEAVMALITESRTPRFAVGHDPDPGLGLDDGPAAYTPDAPWMPPLVLVAKNVLVWLDQISRRDGTTVERLDQVPESELEELARRGFTGLWLIGVWERSPASAALKRGEGQEDATASAYAVRRYRIAEALGGEAALEKLTARARRHGIRLGADFVPNHLAIDSDWVLEHPDRFLALDESPFPSYTFEGPDLSPSADVGITIEDHYRDRTDAAVVFERTDRSSGDRRYLYHGNDGTSTPWNDTAQLDYLRPETRKAVIGEVVEVARRFPILRFDAAMTLTRQHLHRLWYPAPGAAGAIPSRAEHGLTSEAFNRKMPNEFWRELVERMHEVAPDTLLIAEAFWLLEGYFVRRLGMHRVYNSAFMHLLRDGRTAKLRGLLEEMLAVDRELLGRLVNYMTTPDEESAAEQFDCGNRYFGICKVLATLPGLPMFGHGQWEGLREKYGMEFRRSRWEESPDAELVTRHDREIAPLLALRRRFCGVEQFTLLHALDGSGGAAEAVLAYANNRGQDAVVVAFNNADAPTRVRLVEPPDQRGGATLLRRLASGSASPEPNQSDRLDLEDLCTGRRMGTHRGVLLTEGLPVILAPFECALLGPAGD